MRGHCFFENIMNSCVEEIMPGLSIVNTPFGCITFFTKDDPIGKSLAKYGEWAGNELNFLRNMISPGDVVVDVGSNVGTHTLAFSRFVGEHGSVYAFEPQPAVFDVLQKNVAYNDLRNVKAFHAGVGKDVCELHCESVQAERLSNIGAAKLEREKKEGMVSVKVLPLDDISMPRCDLVKIDAEGMESEVLAGMAGVISKYRPTLFIECNSMDSGVATILDLKAFGYTFYLVAAAAFNPANFKANQENFFGFARESSILCVPAEKKLTIPESSETLSVVRIDDFDVLAAAYLAVPRYGDASELERNPAGLRKMMDSLVSQRDSEIERLGGVLRQKDDEINGLIGQIRRLEFRSRSLDHQLDLALNKMKNNASPQIEVIRARSSEVDVTIKNALKTLRKGLSLLSASAVRDPIRRLRGRANG